MTIFDGYSPNMKAAIFTAIVGVPTVLIGLGVQVYNVGYNSGARDIARVDSYKKQLEDMISGLQTIGGSVHQTAQMISENDRLTKENTEKIAENEQQKKQLKSQADELAKAKKEADEYAKQIAEFFSKGAESVVVAESHAETALQGAMLIGVPAIFGYNSFIDANISAGSDFTSGQMKAGETRSLKVADRQCTVRLTAIDKPSTTFSVLCSKN